MIKHALGNSLRSIHPPNLPNQDCLQDSDETSNLNRVTHPDKITIIQLMLDIRHIYNSLTYCEPGELLSVDHSEPEEAKRDLSNLILGLARLSLPMPMIYLSYDANEMLMRVEQLRLANESRQLDGTETLGMRKDCLESNRIHELKNRVEIIMEKRNMIKSITLAMVSKSDSQNTSTTPSSRKAMIKLLKDKVMLAEQHSSETLDKLVANARVVETDAEVMRVKIEALVISKLQAIPTFKRLKDRTPLQELRQRP
ncbi:hypothetical protein BT96DRAFT_921543 [Gymnopus androsaceus JB14]|uniref:Uncharacterized protein n=1 Tax=Gymnopus androsaceus JB14 TaxID=1447944 RepID=A0A6A4HIS4_9AGAR|nr:hypothetical protein BT96DRAFT_921543 [Gymnopus androsaceus JB14]